VCPHCQTQVAAQANICLGCGAEIVRGASKKEKAGAGCIGSVIGILIGLAALGGMLRAIGARNEYGFAIVLGMLVLALAFNFVGRLLVNRFLRSRVRFFRAYQHR
jgi:hypothetical protein